MTIFEYLAIAYSLIFSLAAVRLVAGLPHALDRTHIRGARRPRWTSALCHRGPLLVSMVCAGRGVDLPEISAPTRWAWHNLLSGLHDSSRRPRCGPVLAAVLLLDPSAVLRRAVCVWALVLAVNATVFTGLPFLHPIRGVQLGILAAGVLGLSTDRSAAHLSILVGAALLVALATVLLYSAGPLAV